MASSRKRTFPEVVFRSDTEEESSSDGEEEEKEEEDEEEEVEEISYAPIRTETEDTGLKKKEKKIGKSPITVSLKKVCKVCKKNGHEAGFKGATYIDCPLKPCYLCKMPWHTTMTCPHRIATDHGVVPACRRNTNKSLTYIFERQLRHIGSSVKPSYVIPDQVHCGVVRYHSRRVTCLEFHPTNFNILLSGDKKGQLGVWDYIKVHEKVVYGNIHSCILNNIKFSPMNDGTIYAASSDGSVSHTDLETGISEPLMNLNPNGWQVGYPFK